MKVEGDFVLVKYTNFSVEVNKEGVVRVPRTHTVVPIDFYYKRRYIHKSEVKDYMKENLVYGGSIGGHVFDLH